MTALDKQNLEERFRLVGRPCIIAQYLSIPPHTERTERLDSEHCHDFPRIETLSIPIPQPQPSRRLPRQYPAGGCQAYIRWLG